MSGLLIGAGVVAIISLIMLFYNAVTSLSQETIQELILTMDKNNIKYTAGEFFFIAYINGRSYDVSDRGVRIIDTDKYISLKEFKTLIQ